ncbi:MAG: DNA adenine methylase [Phycisphaerae bacterium]|nr:DNA adenine methylase [Phycisphaerae bacterium]
MKHTWQTVPKAIPGIPHPIPYQGSKRQLARLIVSFFPPNTDRLVEPFAGSAAVSMAAAYLGRARRFVLNDLDTALMGLWGGILNQPTELAAKYRRIWRAQLGNERRYYDLIRTRFNEHRRPEDLLYLLARCVKAAIRYNAQGKFNNSPDNRRKGAHPDTMSRHIRGAAALLANHTELHAVDYKMILKKSRSSDLVYMDPPYQGVCNTHNHRYRHAILYDEFVHMLGTLNSRQVPFILSYDGRTDTKRFGRELPKSLALEQIEVPAGRSTQATLLGRNSRTYESLYLSPVLVERLSHSVEQLCEPRHHQRNLFPEVL